MTRPLKSLEQHNKEKIEEHQKLTRLIATRNGLACPQCGEELADDPSDSTMLTSHPPRLQVVCMECKFQGSRVV